MTTTKLKLPVYAALLLAALALTGCGGGGVEDWNYTVRGQDDDTVLSTDHFTLVLQGESLEGEFHGSFRVAGEEPMEGSKTVGGNTFTYDYSDGETEIQFGGNTITITDGGKYLNVNELTTNLNDSSPRIVVSEGGQIAINP